MSRRILLALVSLWLLYPASLLVYGSVVVVRWCGSTSLTVSFIVTDTDGKPVPGARIEITSGFEVLPDKREEFGLVADNDGVARRTLPDTFCTGSESFFGFFTTFAARLPDWRYRVAPSEWAEWPMPANARGIRREGPGAASVSVPVVVRR